MIKLILAGMCMKSTTSASLVLWNDRGSVSGIRCSRKVMMELMIEKAGEAQAGEVQAGYKMRGD